MRKILYVIPTLSDFVANYVKVIGISDLEARVQHLEDARGHELVASQGAAPQEQPNRIARDMDSARGQSVLQGMQRQLWRLAEPFHYERTMGRKPRPAMPTHLARSNGSVATTSRQRKPQRH